MISLVALPCPLLQVNHGADPRCTTLITPERAGRRQKPMQSSTQLLVRQTMTRATKPSTGESDITACVRQRSRGVDSKSPGSREDGMDSTIDELWYFYAREYHASNFGVDYQHIATRSEGKTNKKMGWLRRSFMSVTCTGLNLIQYSQSRLRGASCG